MARNVEKYIYLTIGILRGGATHVALIKDAEEHCTKHIPTIAGIRLSEYYKLQSTGMFVPTKIPVVAGEVEKHLTSEIDLSAELENASDALDEWPE